tara:strand:- start:1039 stop:1329 length:291 start_codon:yes stop_codon:yes gene_type:complete
MIADVIDDWLHEKDSYKQKQNCNGEIQAHHLLKPWTGTRGWSMKSTDENVVPLCFHHHSQLHQIGAEDAFWEHYNQSRDFGRAYAQKMLRRFDEVL